MSCARLMIGLMVSCVFATSLSADPVTLQPKMGKPVAGLSPSELARFDAGKIAFARVFTVGDGLGPIFNQTSCNSCHINPAGGSGSQTVTRFGAMTKDGFDPLEELGGSLLQAQAISPECAEVIPGGADVTTLRVTNSTMGDGLVESIPDAAIQANETNPPGGIVSGHTHMVVPQETPGGAARVGRFGWKAQVATVLTFSGDASVNELGFTNALFQQDNAPNGDQVRLAQCDTVADPEDHPDPEGVTFIQRVTDFQRFLAAPPQTPRSGMAGAAIFAAVGCADCHVPSFTTDTSTSIEPALRGKVIKPYSDFLVHDMGTLGDGIVQGQANEREIRTPSLWGLRVRDPLLHDGRVAAGTFADRVIAAIAAHDADFCEAQPSAQAFASLSPADQAKVVAFLDSLGRAEFDHNGDNVIDAQDLPFVAACYHGPQNYTADDSCAISDVDQDGDVDDDDFDLFETVYTGPNRDCNNNGTPDLEDLLHGNAKDCNVNGIPDTCDPEYNDVGLFVAQLVATNQNPIFVCMYDRNVDTRLDGLDVQPFVDGLLGP